MSAAEGVLTLTALFQDQATSGLQSFTNSLTAASSAADQAEARITPFNSVLGNTASAVESASGSFNPFNTALNETGAMAGEAVGRLGPLGSAFTEVGLTSRELVGGLGPLGAIFTELGSQAGAAAERMQTLPATETEIAGATRGLGGALTTVGEQFTTAGTDAQVAGTRIQDSQAAMNVASEGGLTLKNTLVGLGTEYQTVTTQANTTAAAHVGLGTKIGLVGGFVGGTTSSVVGLITGYTGLESAAVRVDRAHVMVAASAHTVTVATQAYNAAVAKYGPNSEEARTKLEALDVAQQRYGVNLQRDQLAQQQYNDRLMEFGVNAVNTVSNIVMLGSTLTILKTNMGLASLATTANTEANIANKASMLGMVGGLGPLASVFKTTAAAEGEATLATGSLGLRFLAIAAPIGIAIGLFALIETNTFGMGDAFRATTTVIAQAIDGIVNEVHVLWNGFVGLLNNLAGMFAQWHNMWNTAGQDVTNALNQIIQGAVGFVNTFRSTVIQIVNFFTQDVLNPIIGGWNNFLFGLESSAHSVSNSLIQIFSEITAPILGGFTTMVGGIKSALNTIGRHDLDNFYQSLQGTETSLKQMGSQAQSTGQITKQSFVDGASTIPPLDENIGKVTASTLQWKGSIDNVSQAQHSFDGSLADTNTHIAESIAGIVNYYSHGQNLANLLQSQLPPPLKNFIQLLIQQGGSAVTAAEKMLGLSSATQSATPSIGASAGAVNKHTEVLSAAASAQAAYTKAIADAKAQLVDQTTKEVQTTTATMELARANGFLARGVADAAKAYADAEAKFQTYLGELQNATSIMNLFQSGIVSGKEKLLEFAAQAVTTGAADQAYGQGLTILADKLGFLKSGLEATTQNEEDWIKATNGGTQALEATKKALTDLIGGFYAFGDAIAKNLGDAMDKGSKEFNKALKDLSKQTGIEFGLLKDNMGLKVAAGMQQATDTLKAGLGVMVDAIKGGAPLAGAAIEEWISKMQSEIAGASPTVKAEWQKVFDDLRTIAAQPIPTAASIGKLKTDMEALNIPAQEQAAIFGALPSKYQGAAGAMHTLSAAVQTVISGYNAMGDKVNTVTGEVTDSAGRFIGKLNLQTGAMTQTGTAAGTLATDLAELNITRILATATQEYTTDVDTMARALVQASTDSGTFSTAINKLATAIGVTNNAMATAQRNIDNVAQATQQGTNDFNVFNRAVNTVGQTVNTTNADVGKFATGMGALNRAADSALSAINNDFGGIERSINTDMSSAATDVNTQTGRMLSSVNTNFGAILRNINDDMNNAVRDVDNAGSRIISEFNAIGNSALSQVSKINSLISRMNAIPNISRTITITTVYRTVGSPGGGGGGGTLLTPIAGASGAAGSTTTAVTNTQPIIVSSPQNNNQPIVVQLDGVVVGRMIRKNLFGINSGGIT